ncbi:hypothetical protein Bbelb_239380 [Branchiostoma belcheri]|nr:hypothetical protein Bbelb_239380 [Branchiostoma belcheri]
MERGKKNMGERWDKLRTTSRTRGPGAKFNIDTTLRRKTSVNPQNNPDGVNPQDNPDGVVPPGNGDDVQLEGEARRQVAVLSNADRADVQRLKDRLVEAFGDTAPVSVVMGQFYSRVQLPKETLQSYALALQELLKRADRRRGQPLVDTDSLLRDRFLDGISDEWLRRQLRREILRAPAANPRTFRDIKEEAFHLSGEWGASTSSVQVQASQRVVESTDMTTELTKLREETQKSLDSLRQEISRLTTNSYSVNKTTRGSTAPWATRKSNSRPTDKWDPSGKPICRRCELVGHMERECREGPSRILIVR